MMQKKLFLWMLPFLLFFGILTGCSDVKEPAQEETKSEESTATTDPVTEPAEEEAAQPAFPVTVTDALDYEVVLEEVPERIVTLIPSNTEILYALGRGETVVGVTDFDNYPEEVLNTEKIGGMEFNVEKIISLNPNLVLAHESSASFAEQGLQQLRDAGIKVFIVNNAENFEQVFQTISELGQLTGATKEADTLVADLSARLDAVKEKAAQVDVKRKVFVEVSPAPEIYTAGNNTFMHEMLTIINAENAAGDQEGWIKVDQEAILAINPDVIITTYGYYSENPMEQVKSRDGWQDVTAVKNNQVIDVHSDLVTRQGPRIIEGVEELAKAIYPDIFTN
ncbi:ABC transporter substrate-binding protein [Bacillus sp. HMF5848]|uniref:ABC transporter substrate-binding protein n=1 Tax=Bacillus sp. HMF5848 TaxID=2495421 RepID=UPI000F79BBE3|nr:ABC transporter substrate-binding protein [Bacillus sp. HMF5848]RSK29220.1 ABC transporter substrate-binding protein [Bacillus sp. HMF5848]